MVDGPDHLFRETGNAERPAASLIMS